MNVELWSAKNIEIGAGCLEYEPKSVFVPDNYSLRGNVIFLKFLLMQIASYDDDSNKVQVTCDGLEIQFVVEDELFNRLKLIFGDIVVSAVRHFINFEEEYG